VNIYLGADHNGFELKARLGEYLNKNGYTIIDEGDSVLNQDDDFPQFASRVVAAMMADSNHDVRGILICGSGQGMCMMANRHKGIRASLCWDESEARAARNDDDSNVLCLPARFITQKRAESITEIWLKTAFAGASRFKRRIREMDELA
jgi:ribose 5-phosphate isomerase B